MKIETKFNIGDSCFYFERTTQGKLMAIIPVEVKGIYLEKDGVEYYSQRTGHRVKESELFSFTEALEEFKKLGEIA